MAICLFNLPLLQGLDGRIFVRANGGARLSAVERLNPAMTEAEHARQPSHAALVVERRPPDRRVVTHHRLNRRTHLFTLRTGMLFQLFVLWLCHGRNHDEHEQTKGLDDGSDPMACRRRDRPEDVSTRCRGALWARQEFRRAAGAWRPSERRASRMGGQFPGYAQSARGRGARWEYWSPRSWRRSR